jgi:hypothetical protein
VSPSGTAAAHARRREEAVPGPAPLRIPVSEAAERAVLGAVLADTNCFNRVVDTIGPDDFYAEPNRLIFEAFAHLAADERDIDLLTATDQLECSGSLAAAGGAAYVASLAEGLPDPANVEHYAKILRERSVKRDLLRATQETIAACGSDNGEVETALASLERATTNARARLGPVVAITPIATEELLRIQIPPREYLADPVFREKDIVMFAAGRGIGKTFLGLTVSLGLSSGCPMLGRWRPTRRRRVLHVDGEMAGRALQERISAFIVGSGFDPAGRLYFLAADLVAHGLPSISDTRGQAFYDRMIEETRAEVLVLDNLSCLTQGLDENDALAWEPVQRWFVSLRRRGVATFFAHHLGKGGQQRGTSRREDLLDVSILLAPPEDEENRDGCRFTVRFTKSRGLSGRAVAPFECRLVPGSSGGLAWDVRDAHDETDEMVRELVASGRTVRAIATELGLSKSAVSRRLFRIRKSEEQP